MVSKNRLSALHIIIDEAEILELLKRLIEETCFNTVRNEFLENRQAFSIKILNKLEINFKQNNNNIRQITRILERLFDILSDENNFNEK